MSALEEVNSGLRRSVLLDELFSTLEIDYESLRNSGKYPGGFPASRESIEVLQSVYSEILEDYLEIVQQIDGVAIQTKGRQPPFFYISILSADEVSDYSTLWYPFLSEYMPDWFFFATSGDIETSVPDWEDARYRAPSIRAFLCEGTGLPNG